MVVIYKISRVDLLDNLEASLKIETICHISQVNIRIKVLTLAVMNIGSTDWLRMLRCRETMKLSILDRETSKNGK